MTPLWAWIEVEWLLVGLVALLALPVLVPYGLGPILIYFTQKISGDPELEEFRLRDADVPGAVKRYLFPTIRQVEECGFEMLGAYYVGGLVTNVRSFLVLMGNRAARDLALLAVTYADSLEGSRLQQRHVEYSARLDNGTIVDTNNSQELTAFARVPEQKIVSLPWIEDVRRLYDIHQAAVEYYCPDAQREWHVDADPGDYLHDSLVRESLRQLETGYLYRDAAGDFRPTIKGAILMTYKSLWPITAVRRALRRRRGERLLRELQV
jgi:hypothetical protein